jgi:hypothetical protein
MSHVDRERDALYARLGSIESDLSGASAAISDVESKLAYIDSAMASLPSRLTTVRGRGYAAMGHLEKSIDILTKKWMEASPTIKASLLQQRSAFNSPNSRTLRSDANRLRAEINRGNVAFCWGLAGRLSVEASTLRARVAAETARISASLGEFLGSIDCHRQRPKSGGKNNGALFLRVFPIKAGRKPSSCH